MYHIFMTNTGNFSQGYTFKADTREEAETMMQDDLYASQEVVTSVSHHETHSTYMFNRTPTF